MTYPQLGQEAIGHSLQPIELNCTVQYRLSGGEMIKYPIKPENI